MVSKTQSEQPHWITPVVTVTPRLEQEIRFDAVHRATGDPDWNLGNSKGLELIPQRNIELIFGVPPYLLHESPTAKDGFGDVPFLLKYRIATSNEEHGNYILTFFLGASVPTGSYKNGSTSAIVTPTIAAGKGWRQLSLQTTFGASLPIDDAQKIGHALAWNTAFQYHIARFFWPELEVNSTFFKGGAQDGNSQTFLTPGLVLGRFPIHHRVGLTLGAGFQTAVTHFHNYNHALVITGRVPF